MSIDWSVVELIGLVGVELLWLYFVIRKIISIWKKKELMFKAPWRKLNSFQQLSLQMGVMIFLFLPLFAMHPAKDSYLPKVISEMLAELGKALFIVGMIAFLQQIHPHGKQNGKDKK